MKAIQITIDEGLLARVDQATESKGIARSVFIRQALASALRDLAIEQMEKRQIEGYRKKPVKTSEFGIWEREQAWGSE